MGRKVRENRFRDVLRARLVKAILGPMTDRPNWEIHDRYEAVTNMFYVRVDSVSGTNTKAVSVVAFVKGDEIAFDKESPKDFPSQKLLTQLALVL